MDVFGQPHRTIHYSEVSACVEIIDQTKLPHQFEIVTLKTVADFCTAIKTMQVRGAPLVGITAAYGMAIGLMEDDSPESERHLYQVLMATRPTAINLRWALDRVRAHISRMEPGYRGQKALAFCHQLADDDVAICEAIATNGVALLRDLSKDKKGETLNILTHCNAGWLATVDWGTALAPIYKAHGEGIAVHVWVDETRPRNQGNLTVWELSQQGINHTLIADNTGGLLMQQGRVDCCIVGSDRTTAGGDVCNKVGTYLKALAAKRHDVPFYVALPGSTVDWTIIEGKDIPIEERTADELLYLEGWSESRHGFEIVRMGVEDGVAYNPAFDITPAELVTGLITEHGVYPANRNAMEGLKTLVGLL